MTIKEYILEQYKMHPSMQVQDVVKLCFQAAKGPEHILKDADSAQNYLLEEMKNTEACAEELFEQISDDYVRINLAAWKNKNLPAKWLMTMFVNSAACRQDGNERLEDYLVLARDILPTLQIDAKSWDKFISEYRVQGMPAVHHSDIYREKEKPAYRLVSARYLRLLPILEKLAELERNCVIAIDGRAASGKTTVSALLAEVLDCDIVHMDDFFLPLPLRTEERLNEAGGNVHYERFAEEVLPNLNTGEQFSYRVFDCSIMDYNGERRIKAAPYVIVEGAYSQHPIFGDYAGVKVFSDVDKSLQAERILLRDGEYMLRMFKEKWIPFEENYIEKYNIAAKAHIVI